MWSIANEQESETPENEDYLGPLFDGARQADPSLPTDFVSVMLACQGNGQISQFGYLLIPLQPITLPAPQVVR